MQYGVMECIKPVALAVEVLNRCHVIYFVSAMFAKVD